MKITGRDVPPELATLYASIVSTALASIPGTETARRRVGAGRPAGRRRATRALLDMLQCCVELAEYVEKDLTTPAGREWLGERVARAWRGQPDPDWWLPVGPTYDAYWLSSATSSPRIPVPPFTYRDPSNLPTVPAYGDPEEDAEPARYYGNTAAGYFRDLRLVWHAMRFETPEPNAAGKYPPAWLLAKGKMSVTASHRGARPFFSLVIRAKRGTEAESADQEIDAPTQKVRSHYWRYIVPLSAPPYYTDKVTRRVVQRIPKPNGATLRNWITTVTSPRPLMGKQYNNNREVRSEWQGREWLMLPSPCIGGKRPIYIKTSATQWALWRPDLGTVEPVATPPGTPPASNPGPFFSSFAQKVGPFWATVGDEQGAIIYDNAGTPIATAEKPEPDWTWTACNIAHPDGWIFQQVGEPDPETGNPPSLLALTNHTGETVNIWRYTDTTQAPPNFGRGDCLRTGHLSRRDGWALFPGAHYQWKIGAQFGDNFVVISNGRAWQRWGPAQVVAFRPLPSPEPVPLPGEHWRPWQEFALSVETPEVVESLHAWEGGVVAVGALACYHITTAGTFATLPRPAGLITYTGQIQCHKP